MSVRVIHGDMLAILPTLDADSVHAVVTDPPYHLTTGKPGGSGMASVNPNSPAGRAMIGTGFMGMAWDGGDIAIRPETWAEVYRVLKPGGHLLAFGGTRTQHRMACAIEDAGFEIRDTLCWLYGSGFPKSHNLSGDWQGWGSALKPAYEPIIMARKPLIGTIAANVLAHGCGGINIDGCRVGDFTNTREAGTDRYNQANYEQGYRPDAYQKGSRARPARTPNQIYGAGKGTNLTASPHNETGRWPANVVHDGSDEVMAAFAAYGERSVSGSAKNGTVSKARAGGEIFTSERGQGQLHNDSGTAARFYYCAKASAADRAGSKHPTVKPLALMSWLVKMITPPGGTVLDPFSGSGTTLLAADRAQFNAIGIEQSAEYIADIHRRLNADAGLFADTR